MKHDGGPAFPATHTHYEHGRQIVTPIPGMSKREWFAGRALSHVTADFECVDELARHLYRIADAMLGEAKYRERLEQDRKELVEALEGVLTFRDGAIGAPSWSLVQRARKTLAAIKAREVE